MIEVRFNLGEGKNFQKWQVTNGKKVQYYAPDEVQIEMTDCKLRNFPGVAHQIFEGKNKTVCAWVDCKKVVIRRADRVPRAVKRSIRYNPKKAPYWRSGNGRKIDNKKYSYIVTEGRNLFA